MKSSLEISNINVGHRKRMRKKYANMDIREMLDYEILEMLLFYAVPRADTKNLSKILLKKYGSLAGVISASAVELKRIEGAGEAVEHLFKLMLDLNSRLILPVSEASSSISSKDILSDWNAVLNYCKLTMGHKVAKEYFRVLYLNSKNAVIGDECHEGTVDRVSIYPREIAKKSLEYGASSVILVHNHPSGDTRPSKEDIDVTRTICDALRSLNILVHDHIIVSNFNHFSFKANKLM
jgi:DNA repair protein RadC